MAGKAPPQGAGWPRYDAALRRTCEIAVDLAAAAWAFARHRRLPQLLTGGWLHPGFLQRCVDAGYPSRLPTPALTP